MKKIYQFLGGIIIGSSFCLSSDKKVDWKDDGQKILAEYREKEESKMRVTYEELYKKKVGPYLVASITGREIVPKDTWQKSTSENTGYCQEDNEQVFLLYNITGGLTTSCSQAWFFSSMARYGSWYKMIFDICKPLYADIVKNIESKMDTDAKAPCLGLLVAMEVDNYEYGDKYIKKVKEIIEKGTIQPYMSAAVCATFIKKADIFFHQNTQKELEKNTVVLDDIAPYKKKMKAILSGSDEKQKRAFIFGQLPTLIQQHPDDIDLHRAYFAYYSGNDLLSDQMFGYISSYVNILENKIQNAAWKDIRKVDFVLLRWSCSVMEDKEDSKVVSHIISLFENMVTLIPEEYQEKIEKQDVIFYETPLQEHLNECFVRAYNTLADWYRGVVVGNKEIVKNDNEAIVRFLEKAIRCDEKYSKKEGLSSSLWIKKGTIALEEGEYFLAATCYEKLLDMYTYYEKNNILDCNFLSFLWADILYSIVHVAHDDKYMFLHNDTGLEKFFSTVNAIREKVVGDDVYDYKKCIQERYASGYKDVESFLKKKFYWPLDNKIITDDQLRILFEMTLFYRSFGLQALSVFEAIDKVSTCEMQRSGERSMPASFFIAHAHMSEKDYSFDRDIDDIMRLLAGIFLSDKKRSAQAEKMLERCIKRVDGFCYFPLLLHKKYTDIMEEHGVGPAHPLVYEGIKNFLMSDMVRWFEEKSATCKNISFVSRLIADASNNLCIVLENFLKNTGDTLLRNRCCGIVALSLLQNFQEKYTETKDNPIILEKLQKDYEPLKKKLKSLEGSSHMQSLFQEIQQYSTCLLFANTACDVKSDITNSIIKMAQEGSVEAQAFFLKKALTTKQNMKEQQENVLSFFINLWEKGLIAESNEALFIRTIYTLYPTLCLKLEKEVHADQKSVLTLIRYMGGCKTWDNFLSSYNDFYCRERIFEKKELKKENVPPFLSNIAHTIDKKQYDIVLKNMKQYCDDNKMRVKKNFWIRICIDHFLVTLRNDPIIKKNRTIKICGQFEKHRKALGYEIVPIR
ncbi:MAG TPA: hypothetical protein VEK38_03935 [Candidatus Bathyarchaeia archaeon]|nr:hypothetical protein [Candidatus Bathyarchaeia archaeon]